MENSNTENPIGDFTGAIGNGDFGMFPEINENDLQNVFQMEGMEIEQPNGAFEIVPGMTVEEMQTMFFDTNALIEPPYKVWQLNSKGHRYYYRYDDNGNPEFFPSVTTILSQTMPKSPHLIKWIAERGIDEAERYKEERAAYGSFMHAEFEKLLINRTYDLDNLKTSLKEYIMYQRLPDDFIYYADDLKKDVLAFAQFIIDYDVKPLAVEIALVHPWYKYAGMIDLPCTMLDRPGGIKRINAIVDFKSGKKGFYEDHEIQLHLYKDLWNVNFEHLQIERVYNFAPKDWRKRPTYNLKDQTKSANAFKIPHLLEIAAIEDNKKDNIFTAVSGIVNLDSNPDLVENITSLTLSELIKTKAPKEKTPDKKTAVTAKDLKADEKKENKPVEKKKTTTIVKRKPAEPKKEPQKLTTTKRQPKTPETKEKPAEVKKEAKNEGKKSLLNNDLDI